MIGIANHDRVIDLAATRVEGTDGRAIRVGHVVRVRAYYSPTLRSMVPMRLGVAQAAYRHADGSTVLVLRGPTGERHHVRAEHCTRSGARVEGLPEPRRQPSG